MDDDLVVLDVAADSYSCLPGAAQAWRDLVSQRGTDLATALAEAFAASSLGPPAELQDGTGRRLQTLRRTAISDHPEPARVQDVLHLLGAWLDLQLHYERRALGHILAHATARRAPSDDIVDPELLRLCRVFRQMVVWLPVSGKCLVRSFLLIRFLQRSGRDARWVFAVSTWPFVAHCWLQVADTALDDRPDRVRGYMPICVF